ncbi:hypothetical protein QUC31_011192 [Theobroma cacao]
MAISLSTSLMPNTFQSNRNPKHRLTRVLLNQLSNFSLKHRENENKISTRRSPLVASTISGSTGVPSSGVSLDTADSLDTVKVFDLNGNGIPISDLWKDRKAVVAFARHFGCVLCRKRADYLASKKDVMDKSGVALVLIGPGSIEQASWIFVVTKAIVQCRQKHLQRKLNSKEVTESCLAIWLLSSYCILTTKCCCYLVGSEVYADPSHSSYEALIFVSGVTTTFTPKAGLKIIQLYMEGYRQDWKLSFEEDTVKRGGWQQGGILVAGPGKRNISYIHKDKEAGDDPDIEDILKACCS